MLNDVELIKKYSRRQTRIRAMEALFAWKIAGKDPSAAELIYKPYLMELEQIGHRNNAMLLLNLFNGVVEHHEEFDRLLRRLVRNWDVNRMANIDHILLWMGIYEFLYEEDIPPEVTMDEYIEIAKQYGTADSSRFINGVLDAAYHTLLREGKIQKVLSSSFPKGGENA